MRKKTYSISFISTLFTVIIVYFIYKYAQQKGWGFLAILAKIYIIVVGGLLTLFAFITILVSLVLMGFFIYSRYGSKKYKKREDEVIDAKFKIKK